MNIIEKARAPVNVVRGAGWSWLDYALADGAQALGLGPTTGQIARRRWRSAQL